jgi:hypothetical protein
MAARLVNSRRKARVRTNLLGRAKTFELAEFCDDQECRVQANAVNVGQRFHLRK